MRQGLVLAAVGLALGAGLSMSATKLMGGLLYNTPATDAATFLLVATTLIGIASLACFLPARRALKIDPVQALRPR